MKGKLEKEEYNKMAEKREEMNKNSSEVNFLVEKDSILRDMKNVCTFIHLKFIQKMNDKRLDEFPFKFIIGRICYTFSKYLEQSNLLDQIMEQVVVPVMILARQMIKMKFEEYLNDKEGFIAKYKNDQ